MTGTADVAADHNTAKNNTFGNEKTINYNNSKNNTIKPHQL